MPGELDPLGFLLGRQRWERRLWTPRKEGALWSRALRSPLWLLSLLYAAIMETRTRAYQLGLFPSVRLPVRVIAVGNLTVGGTGKTPVVAWIATRLRERGCRPVVISRGYGGRPGREPLIVSEGEGPVAPIETAGDEAVILARKLPGIPIVIHPSRRRAAELVVARFHPSHLILDDAYQHLAVQRDVNLLILDAQHNPADLFLLPRGPLRESISAAGRADAVILSHAPGPEWKRWEWLERLCPHTPVFLMRYRPAGIELIGQESGKDPEVKPSLAFCGIGRPDSFFAYLSAAGVPLRGTFSFPDHYQYCQADLKMLVEEARRRGAERLFTTEKDAVKIQPEWLDGFTLAVFLIEPDFFSREEELLALLHPEKKEDGKEHEDN